MRRIIDRGNKRMEIWIGTLVTMNINNKGTREKKRFAKLEPVVDNINDVLGKKMRLKRSLPHNVEFIENCVVWEKKVQKTSPVMI